MRWSVYVYVVSLGKNADVTAGGNEDKDASLDLLSEKAATRSPGEESGNEGGAPLDARTDLSYISGSPSSETARHAPDYDRPQKLPFYKRRVTGKLPVHQTGVLQGRYRSGQLE